METKSRPVPPGVLKLPAYSTAASSDSAPPMSPTSPTRTNRPLPQYPIPTNTHTRALSPRQTPQQGPQAASAEHSHFTPSQTTSIATSPPQRPMSPPPFYPLPALPNNPSNASLRARPLPPNLEVPNPSISQPPINPKVYQPRIVDDKHVSSKLGTTPTGPAPMPPHNNESTNNNASESEQVVKRVASPSVTKYSIDLGGKDVSKSKKSNGSGGLFSPFLSKSSQSKQNLNASSSESGFGSISSGSHEDKLRAHFKQIFELPENYFNPVAPEFSFSNHRDRVAFEFFTSELSYNNFLKILINVYRAPLLAAVKAGDVQCKEEEIRKVFGSIDAIFQASEIVLLGLEEKIRSWDPNSQLLGDVFVKYGDVLKVYATFAREQQNAKLALENCLSKSQSFNIMLKLSQQHPACQSRDLSSLQIMPIQRIPRYELLLRDFIKATPNDHPDYPLLNQSLLKIKSVAEQVDRSVEEYKQLETILSIQKSCSGSVNLIMPGRRFIRQGTLIKVCRRANKTRMFWLFSDMLMYGIPILTGSFVVSAQFPLNNLRLQDQLEDISITSNSNSKGNDDPSYATHLYNGEKLQFGFLIQSKSKSFIVYAQTNQEKVDWMIDIMNCVKSHNDGRKTIIPSNAQMPGEADQTDDGEAGVAPAWQPDSAAPQCLLCKSHFSLVTRRHHCRRCGIVVCDDCSKRRVVLPGLDKNSVRVCDKCSASIPPTPKDKSSSHNEAIGDN